jgi:hypothetical protein
MTRHPAIALPAALAAVLAVAPAALSRDYEPTTGVALHEACGGGAPHVCLSYIAGIVDMHEVGLAGGQAPLFCPRMEAPEKVGRGVWLYYERNPDALEQPAALGAIQALALMFPCE